MRTEGGSGGGRMIFAGGDGGAVAAVGQASLPFSASLLLSSCTE